MGLSGTGSYGKDTNKKIYLQTNRGTCPIGMEMSSTSLNPTQHQMRNFIRLLTAGLETTSKLFLNVKMQFAAQLSPRLEYGFITQRPAVGLYLQENFVLTICKI